MSGSNMTSAQKAEENMRRAVAIRDQVGVETRRAQPLLQAQRPSMGGIQWQKDKHFHVFDPENPLMYWQQTRLYTSLHLGGYRGLIEELVDQHEISRDLFLHRGSTTVNTSARHRYILDDYEHNDHKGMAVLLGCIHHEILSTLIKGNITGRCYEDEKFKNIVDGYAYLTTLPCIYINEIVNRQYINDVKQPYPGRCLNWHEWRLVLSRLEQYSNEARITPQTLWVKTVHEQFPSTSAGGDRYLKSDKSFDMLEKFILENRWNYVRLGKRIFKQNPNDPSLNIPFKRVPREIGWAKDGLSRAAQHLTQTQSNHLYGLFQAVLWALFGRNRFEVKQYELLPVPDASLAQLAESMCSQVGFSYWEQGSAGLNPEFAGTIPMTKILAPDFQHKFDAVKARLSASNIMRMNLAVQIEQEHDVTAILTANTNVLGQKNWFDKIEDKQSHLRAKIEDVTEKADKLVIRAGIEKIKEWEKKHYPKSG